MSLSTSHLQLFDIDLEPASGSRFQPTGFPDLGAATFERPVRTGDTTVWESALIVESAQSMANHLEAVGWNAAASEPVATLEGLPFVRVSAGDDGRYLTSSRTEAHRLASAFIKDSELDSKSMVDTIRERLRLRDDTPLAPRDIAESIMELDPLCLIHGVFFADSRWPGQPKVTRAITGFIEASDVRPANSGGVKRDDVRHQIGESGGASEGYGFVPFHRTEYAAGRIVASFAIDLAQIASYGLPEPAADLLATIARWEIRALFDGGLRLRTACDLVPLREECIDREGHPLPPLVDLDAGVKRLIVECRSLLGAGGPIQVSWNGGKKRATKKKAETDARPEEG